MKTVHIGLSILLIGIFLAACRQSVPDRPPQPTLEPQVNIPQIPSSTPEPTQTPVIEPTQTPVPSATPTNTPLPTATAVPLTILEPAADLSIPAGADLAIRGIDETAANGRIHVTVRIGEWLLAEKETAVAGDGTWNLTIALPPHLTGPATITARPATSQQTQSILVHIQPNIDINQTYILFDRPYLGETAVAGHAVFFNGEINRPINRTLDIGILHDGCSRFAARQTFELGNGQWQGMLVIPSDIAGPACAMARTGNPDTSDEWLAALMPLDILAGDNENAAGITLGNTGELLFSATEPVYLFGTAVHAPNNELNLLLTSDDGTYKLLVNETVAVNSYGFWETTLHLSERYTGFALLTASMGAGDNYYELRHSLEFTK